MRRGSVTCLVRGQTADAGYPCGEGRAVRLSAIYCEAVSEIPAGMPRVS
jgi:hypothetical protein